MKITCKQTTAKKLDLTEVNTIFNQHYNYYLALEETYIVMGLAIFKRSPCLYYLIDDRGYPDWYPYPLFEISDPKIPSNWYIQTFDKKTLGGIHFLSGFYELVCNEDFHDDLMERERYAMEIYFKRKIEAEKEQ